MIPKKIHAVHVPSTIFKKTVENFRQAGLDHKESIAYWTGKLEEQRAVIKHVIFADDYQEFNNEELFAQMPLSATLKIGELIHQQNEILIAQVHSHPFEAFHSFIDDQNPISHRIGFFSIVVPFFGENVTNLLSCKTFEYLGNSKWNELKDNELESRFTMEEGLN